MQRECKLDDFTGRSKRRGCWQTSTNKDFLSISLSAKTMVWSAEHLGCVEIDQILLQLRRQARERRQYVYAKSLEAQERLTYERKRQLKNALGSGKSLPTELRKDAQQLSKELAFDEAQAGACRPCMAENISFNPGDAQNRLPTLIMNTIMLV